MNLNIPFSEEEINRLINVYQKEKEALEEKLEVVKSTLSKLREAVGEIPAKETKKKNNAEPKKKVKKDGTKSKKRGRKPHKRIKALDMKPIDIRKVDWREYVTSAIRNQNEVMNSDSLTHWATKQMNLSEYKYSFVQEYVEAELERLVNEKVLEQEVMNGHTYFGYSPWFGPDGKVKKEYYPSYSKEEIDKEEEKLIEQAKLKKEKTELQEDSLQSTIIKLLDEKKHLLMPSEIYDYLNEEISISKEELVKLLDEMVIDELLKKESVSDSDEYQYGPTTWFKKGDGKLKVYYLAHK